MASAMMPRCEFAPQPGLDGMGARFTRLLDQSLAAAADGHQIRCSGYATPSGWELGKSAAFFQLDRGAVYCHAANRQWADGRAPRPDSARYWANMRCYRTDVDRYVSQWTNCTTRPAPCFQGACRRPFGAQTPPGTGCAPAAWAELSRIRTAAAAYSAPAMCGHSDAAVDVAVHVRAGDTAPLFGSRGDDFANRLDRALSFVKQLYAYAAADGTALRVHLHSETAADEPLAPFDAKGATPTTDL